MCPVFTAVNRCDNRSIGPSRRDALSVEGRDLQQMLVGPGLYWQPRPAAVRRLYHPAICTDRPPNILIWNRERDAIEMIFYLCLDPTPLRASIRGDEYRPASAYDQGHPIIDRKYIR